MPVLTHFYTLQQYYYLSIIHDLIVIACHLGFFSTALAITINFNFSLTLLALLSIVFLLLQLDHARAFIKYRDEQRLINYSSGNKTFQIYPHKLNPKNLIYKNIRWQDRKSDLFYYFTGFFTPLLPLYYYYKHYPALQQYLIWNGDRNSDNVSLFSNIPLHDYIQLKSQKFYQLFNNKRSIGWFTLFLLFSICSQQITNFYQIKLLLVYAVFCSALLLLCDNLEHFWEYSWFSMLKCALAHFFEHCLAFILAFALVTEFRTFFVVFSLISVGALPIYYYQLRYIGEACSKRQFLRGWVQSSALVNWRGCFSSACVNFSALVGDYVELFRGSYYMKYHRESCDYYCRENNAFFYPIAQWLNESYDSAKNSSPNSSENGKDLEFHRKLYAINKFFAQDYIEAKSLLHLTNERSITRYNLYSRLLQLADKSRALSISKAELHSAAALYAQNHAELAQFYAESTKNLWETDWMAYSPGTTGAYMGEYHLYFNEIYKKLYYFPRKEEQQLIYHKKKLQLFSRFFSNRLLFYITPIYLLLHYLAVIFVSFRAHYYLNWLHGAKNFSPLMLYGLLFICVWLPADFIIMSLRIWQWKRGRNYISNSRSKVLIADIFHLDQLGPFLFHKEQYLDTERNVVDAIKLHYQYNFELEEIVGQLTGQFPMELTCLIQEYYDAPAEYFKFDPVKHFQTAANQLKQLEDQENDAAVAEESRIGSDLAIEMPLLVQSVEKEDKKKLEEEVDSPTHSEGYSMIPISDYSLAPDVPFESRKQIELSGWMKFNPLFNARQIDSGEHKVWVQLIQSNSADKEDKEDKKDKHNSSNSDNSAGSAGVMNYIGTITTLLRNKSAISSCSFNLNSHTFELTTCVVPNDVKIQLLIKGQFRVERSNEIRIEGEFKFLHSQACCWGVDRTSLEFTSGQVTLSS
jgi:hypothetical protein